MDKISVVVPCFNEEDVIELFYHEISKVMDKMNEVCFEIIFVDDGSYDKSLKIMKKLNEMDKRVRFISFSRNFGKEAAIYAGLSEATGDYITLMDVDLQDPPKMLIKMYQTIKAHDVDSVGLKADNYDSYNVVRKALTKLYYAILTKISKVEMVIGARDFRLMSRRMVKAVLSMKEYNRYSKGLFNFVGFDTIWLTYKIPKRAKGETKWNFFKLFAYAMDAIIGFSTGPLMLATIFGLLLCLLSGIALVVILIKKIAVIGYAARWPSTFCMMFFLSGIQLFSIGISAIYLSKTYTEVKRRPLYIIKEVSEESCDE